MITKKDLEKKLDGDILETVCLVKSYAVKAKKSGQGSYIEGELELKGTVPFKVWDGSVLYEEMTKCDYKSTVCNVKGKVNEFGGSKSLILSGVAALEGYNAEDFFEERYNVDAYWMSFTDLLTKKLSPEAYGIFEKVTEPILDRLKVEFAAKGMHDATKGGLLAHTYKVTHLMSRALLHYPEIVKACSLDALILGSALHDIGKIFEYKSGSMSDLGCLVSHHTFGVEILLTYKDYIISVKDEEFFYRLLSVVEQHHGEFEESPRTIEAYAVHLVDYLESRFQIMEELLSKGADGITIDSFKLR